MGALLIICTLIYYIAVCKASDLQNLPVMDGQGVLAFLNTSHDFGTIKLCKVSFEKDTQEYVIDMKAGSQQNIITKRGEIISPYSSTHCGIRILKISFSSEGKWYVKVYNEKNREVIKIFQINVVPKPEPNTVTKSTKTIGLGTLKCSNSESAKSCRISNDKDLSFERCEASVIFREPSTWYCRTMNWGTMEETTETIHVWIEKNMKSSIATVEETAMEFILGCKLPQQNIPGCRAEYPNEKNQLYIGGNLHHERYSTAGTDLKEGYCVLSIRKPITNKEKGIWKIYQLDTSATPSALKGCILYLGDQKNLIQKSLNEETDRIRTLEVVKSNDPEKNDLVDDTFSLTCKVPFVLDRCYLRDPSGRVHFQNEFDFKYSRTLGMCIFRNLPKIHGRWICGHYGSDYGKEIIQEYEVKTTPKEGEVINATITTLSGDTIDLLCRTAMAEPISQCAFTDPKGKVYLLSNQLEQFDDSRISYFGQGLQYGHCGLKIKDINKSEFGKWTCQFSGQKTKNLLSIQVQEPPTSLATIIGASVGVAAVLSIAIIGVFILIRRRKRNRAMEHNSGNGSNSPETTSL